MSPGPHQDRPASPAAVYTTRPPKPSDHQLPVRPIGGRLKPAEPLEGIRGTRCVIPERLV